MPQQVPSSRRLREAAHSRVGGALISEQLPFSEQEKWFTHCHTLLTSLHKPCNSVLNLEPRSSALQCRGSVGFGESRAGSDSDSFSADGSSSRWTHRYRLPYQSHQSSVRADSRWAVHHVWRDCQSRFISSNHFIKEAQIQKRHLIEWSRAALFTAAVLHNLPDWSVPFWNKKKMSPINVISAYSNVSQDASKRTKMLS